MKNAPFLNLVLAVILAIAVGWLLMLGRDIILPIVTAIILVYIMGASVAAMARLPLMESAPPILLRGLVLVAFTIGILGFAIVISVTVRDIVEVLPRYQQNIGLMVQGLADRFGFEAQAFWDDIRAVTTDRLDMQAIVLAALGGFTSVSAAVVVVVIYAGFLLSERATFADKVMVAMNDEARGRKALQVVTDINAQVGQYLAVKTFINAVTGLISFVILWLLGVDFALFWAIAIALLKFIPYLGSFLGVGLPVIVSLGQFGAIEMSLILLALLGAAHALVGNVLEPRWVGQQLNMSPTVVLTALAIWGALWGTPGAILAIPMTSILIIITAGFESTRFVAVLLSARAEDASPAEDARTEH